MNCKYLENFALSLIRANNINVERFFTIFFLLFVFYIPFFSFVTFLSDFGHSCMFFTFRVYVCTYKHRLTRTHARKYARTRTHKINDDFLRMIFSIFLRRVCVKHNRNTYFVHSNFILYT